jgi:hypothetical protein
MRSVDHGWLIVGYEPNNVSKESEKEIKVEMGNMGSSDHRVSTSSPGVLTDEGTVSGDHLEPGDGVSYDSIRSAVVDSPSLLKASKGDTDTPTLSEVLPGTQREDFLACMDKEIRNLENRQESEDVSPHVTLGDGLVRVSKSEASTDLEQQALVTMEEDQTEEQRRFLLAEIIEERLEPWNVDTWSVMKRTDVPEGRKVLPETWTLKIKRHPDGTFRKTKARYCARGDKQIEGFDCFEKYAPVAQWSTVSKPKRDDPSELADPPPDEPPDKLGGGLVRSNIEAPTSLERDVLASAEKDEQGFKELRSGGGFWSAELVEGELEPHTVDSDSEGEGDEEDFDFEERTMMYPVRSRSEESDDFDEEGDEGVKEEPPSGTPMPFRLESDLSFDDPLYGVYYNESMARNLGNARHLESKNCDEELEDFLDCRSWETPDENTRKTILDFRRAGYSLS